MRFESIDMVADIYDEQVRAMVGAVVETSTGAAMLLTRGRAIRDFRAKLAEMGDEERKRLTARYTGVDGKRYENDSWRGLWDKILDSSYAMDAKGNHRSRAMAKFLDFLDIAEAIEARSPSAVPATLVVHSRALSDLQRRAKNAELDRDRTKLLAVMSEAFVVSFDKIGGTRRITGSRADALIVDAALVELCAKEGIDVASGVPPPRPRGGATAARAAKRPREETEDAAGECASAPRREVGETAPEHDPLKTMALECYEKMSSKMGDTRAIEFMKWLVKESQKWACDPSAKVSDLEIIDKSYEEEFEEEG